MAAQLFEFSHPSFFTLPHSTCKPSTPRLHSHFVTIMPRMHNDLNFNICPDYTSDIFTDAGAQFINENY